MPEEVTQLKETLGLPDVIMFGVGGIAGAGIYAIIGEAAGLAGSALWMSFGLAALVALLTGLAYAEFVSQFPDAGGSFEYIKQGFGPKPALYLSVIMFLTGVIAPAAIAISFSDYLSRLLDFPTSLTTAGIIILMGLINIIGLKQSSWFNTAATIITLLGLGAVVAFAIPEWGNTALMNVPDGKGLNGILAGSALIFFSYVGFEDLVKIAEEVKEPEKNMPLGILLSGVIVLIIYLLIAVSAVSVISPSELSKTDGPLSQVLSATAGSSWVTGITVVALFATSKTILSNIMGAGRLLFDVGRDSDIRWLKRFSKIKRTTGSPAIALAAITLVVIAFSMIGNLKVVASLSNICVFILFISVNLALLRYRYKHENGHDAPFRIPLNIKNIPIPTVVAILGLLVLLGFNIYNII